MTVFSSPLVGLLPRRDEQGRWQAESAELRGLRHAQLARPKDNRID